MQIDDLIQAIELLRPFPEQVKLRVGVVVSPDQFFKSHATILKSNPGQKTFEPYYLRLLEFYEKLTQEKR